MCTYMFKVQLLFQPTAKIKCAKWIKNNKFHWWCHRIQPHVCVEHTKTVASRRDEPDKFCFSKINDSQHSETANNDLPGNDWEETPRMPPFYSLHFASWFLLSFELHPLLHCWQIPGETRMALQNGHVCLCGVCKCCYKCCFVFGSMKYILFYIN